MNLKTVPTDLLLLEILRRNEVEAINLNAQEAYAISADRKLVVLLIPSDVNKQETVCR